MRFDELNLAPPLLQALTACGYEEPTPIQAQTIPALLAGRDVIGSAQTGTGKTAAFVLPALHRLAKTTQTAAKHRMASAPRVLVLAPTRELAQQVAEQAVRYGQHLRICTVCLYGGAPYPVQNRQLQRGADFLVATPGRLLDHIERGRVDLSRLEVLVLDEADRMLDMGFIDDVERICALTPATRQTALFSATFVGAIGPPRRETDPRSGARRRARRAGGAARHRAARAFRRRPLAQVQDARPSARRCRNAAEHCVHVHQARRRGARRQAQGEGHAAAALHGDMNQHERNRTLSDMRRGGVRTLVATDVAARGIDVPGLTHVINFDLAAAGAGLRASHRPHGSRGCLGDRRLVRESCRTRDDPNHRAFHRRGDSRPCDPGTRATLAVVERRAARPHVGPRLCASVSPWSRTPSNLWKARARPQWQAGRVPAQIRSR
jgi:superfamily II DNA/RNA helicase